MRPSALPSDLRAGLRAALPARDPRTLEPLGEGYGATAYRWPAPPGGITDTLVVRVPKHEAAAARLAVEARLLPALEGTGVPFVPHGAPHRVRAVTGDDGRLLAVVHRYVEGVPVRRATLRGRRRERLVGQIAAFLAALHRFPAAEARALGVPVRAWSDIYPPLVEAARPHLGPRGVRWVERAAACLLADGSGGGASGAEPAPHVLVHGDIAAHHLWLDEAGGLAGVIDYDHAMVADPALDFAGVALALGWRFMERVLAAYPAHGGPAAVATDPGLPGRARACLDLEPLFEVAYGTEAGDAAAVARGRRRIAARAGAASRAGGRAA